ncbi:MAG: hypothetical protein QF886_14615, partial [Planctomycetota bacterium]|nr:hypothetical protein [Planctomycetota bacterium]
MSEKFVQSLVLLTLAQWPVFGQDARLPDGAKLVFEDAFNRKKLGSFAQGFIKPEDRAKLNWCVRKGTWEIRFEKDGNNGYLFGKGGPAEIVLDKNLRSNLRLEYTAWSTNPGDRSAFLCVPLPNFRYEDIYGFHFAGGYSKYNVLVRKRRSMTQQAKSPLPKAGQKWRVAVQKADSLLQMIVDGKAVFSVKDPEYHALRDKLTTAQGTCIGLYTWSDGMCFDDLKVFNLPETRGEQLPKDAEVTYSLWQGLENVKEGQLPDGLHLKAGPSCSVRVIDEPTVVYRPKPKGQEMVRDRCLELKDDRMGKDELASITIPIEPISTGEVEAELLAWSYEGACAELSLVDKDGKELASLVVGENGAFFAKTPGGVQKLKDRISYLNRPRNARFYLQPKRWFTFRLSFNADAGVYHASVVNLYLGLGRPGVGFVPLGSDIPMLGKRKVCGVRLSTLGKAHLL